MKNSPEFECLSIRSVGPRLEEAEKLLTDGQVVDVAGTMAKYNFLYGIRCQIGVVAVNHQGEQIRHSFILQAGLREEVDAVLDRTLHSTRQKE